MRLKHPGFAGIPAIFVRGALPLLLLIGATGPTRAIATSRIDTVAGNHSHGYSGNGGAATAAQLNGPGGVAVDASGNLYIADYGNSLVRKVDTNGKITTVAGNFSLGGGYSGDGGAATSAQLFYPFGVAVDASGNLYIADSENLVIRKVTAVGGQITGSSIITTVAGNQSLGIGYSGDGGFATDAQFRSPNGVAIDASGNLFIADTINNVIRKVTAVGGQITGSSIITTVAGNHRLGAGYSGDGDTATSAQLFYPIGVAVDASGNLFIADTYNNVIRKVDHGTEVISTVAGMYGDGSGGYSGDGIATSVQLNSPYEVVVDASGNLFIADTDNSVIRKVDTNGNLTTVAGNSRSGYSGNGGAATSAQLYYPFDVAVDASGNLFIGDTYNNVIRKVSYETTYASVTPRPPDGLTVTLAFTDLAGGIGTPTIYAGLDGSTPTALASGSGTVKGTVSISSPGVHTLTFYSVDSAGTEELPHQALSLTAPLPPLADGQSVSVLYNIPSSLTLSATDPEGNTLTYSVVTSPSHGTVSGTAPNLTYTPASGFIGTDSFLFKANDGVLGSNTATVSITVAPTPPTASSQSVSLHFGVITPVTLSATDTDGHSLTYSVLTSPSNGTLTGTAPNLTYHPARGYTGSDSFIFQAMDGSIASNIATVSITVTDTAPVASSQSVTTIQDTPQPITLSATDPDGDPITSYSVYSPVHGTLSGTAPHLTYTPPSGFVGTDSFLFKANDGPLSSTPATVTITVTPNAPTANPQSVSLHFGAITPVTLTATDTDGHPLTYLVLTSPTNGTLTGTAPNLKYHPANHFIGSDSFTFQAMDGTVASNTATVTLTVSDTAPIASSQSVSTSQGTALPITLSATDPDGDPIASYSVVTSPSHGTLSGTAPHLTYTPASGFAGTDSFTFKVSDGLLSSTAVTVSITVNPAPPTANPQTVSLHFGVITSVTLTGTDTDGHALAYSVVTSPSHGTLTGTAPNLTYHPANHFTGSDSFTFQAIDGTVASTTATVTINVTDTAPVASSQSVTTSRGTQVSITLSATDPDGDPITSYSVYSPVHGTLSGTAPNLTYTPPSGFTGTDSFLFKANDGPLSSTAATVTITVTP